MSPRKVTPPSFEKGRSGEDVFSSLPMTEMVISTPKEWKPDNVRSFRRSLGISQVLLASLLGVSRRTVEGWEAPSGKIPGPVARLLSLFEEDRKLLEKHNILVFKTSS